MSEIEKRMNNIAMVLCKNYCTHTKYGVTHTDGCRDLEADVKEIARLKGEIERLKRENVQLTADINCINQAFRKAGWGQGEIDAYAVEVERYEERIKELEAGLRRYAGHQLRCKSSICDCPGLIGLPHLPQHKYGRCDCGLSTLLEAGDGDE